MSDKKIANLPKIYVAQNLKVLLKKSAYTGLSLAEYLGVSNNTISAWVNGVSAPKLEYVVVLATLFDVDLARFISEDLLAPKPYLLKEPAPLSAAEMKDDYNRRISEYQAITDEMIRQAKNTDLSIAKMNKRIDELTKKQ